MLGSFGVKFIRLDLKKYVGMARQASPFLRCFWSRLINFKSKETNVAFSILRQTTYVIRRLPIREIKPLRIVECSKSYCKSCGFQSVPNASRSTKIVSNKAIYYSRVSFQFLFDPANTSAIHVSLILRCIAIATVFQQYKFIVNYCPLTSTFWALNFSLGVVGWCDGTDYTFSAGVSY